MNPCHFSPCRRYRYTLTHDFADLFGAPAGTGYVAWIGLNPSTADEGRFCASPRYFVGTGLVQRHIIS